MARHAGGDGRTAVQVAPAALAALADGVSADLAAQAARSRGERDLAAGLLAERIRAADTFAATYGVPWWPAYVAIARAVGDRESGNDSGQVAEPTRWASVGPFVALAFRLGYVDGVRGLGRARGGPDTDGAAFIHGATRSRRAMRAYRSGRAYGSAERILAAEAPMITAVIDARAATMRAWMNRWRGAVRWTLRGDVRGRLLAGRRVRTAVQAALRRHDETLAPHRRDHIQRAVWAYAGGRARSLRQRAARRDVDRRVARASADAVEGAMLACTGLARGRGPQRERVAVRDELVLDLSVAGMSPADIAGLAGGAEPRPALVERRPDLLRPHDATGTIWGDDREALCVLMRSLAAPPPAGNAWGRAWTAPWTPTLDDPVRDRLHMMVDVATARIVRAECEFVDMCGRSALPGAEGWVRTYQTEADALPADSVERTALLVRAVAVEAVLEMRADREAYTRFAECLASDVGDDTVEERCARTRHRAHDVVRVGASLQAASVGSGPDLDTWTARVHAAIDLAAARWLAQASEHAARRSIRGRAAAALQRGANRARRWWRWVTAPTGLVVASSERVTSRRLVQGRPVTVIAGLTWVAFALLDAARAPASIVAATVFVGLCFVGGACVVASRADPYWWRAGTTSLFAAGMLAALIGPPPGASVRGAGRVGFVVEMWILAAPIAVLVVGRIIRRRGWRPMARQSESVRSRPRPSDGAAAAGHSGVGASG